ncbi:MAG: PilZ domain-containing protein [Candidatus Omnitrophota bacterium]
MAELKPEQYFILSTGKNEYCGKVKGIKSETEYQITFINNKISESELNGQPGRVYYQNKDGNRCFFQAILEVKDGIFYFQQIDSAVFRGRRFSRFKLNFPMTVKNENLLVSGVVKNDALSGQLTNVKTFDVSAGGVGVISETPFQINSILIIELNFYGEKIKAIVEVKYCIEKKTLFLSGLEFSVISDEARKKIEDLFLALEV